ncbi:MAG TPA: hypothetical protein VK975_01420 [Acidimicrobiales bacterium]|nr:hypothetical protein [Acidimicrobiales bacterium]
MAHALRLGGGGRRRSTAAAARLVVVDAVDEAAVLFYEHHGFVRAPGHPLRLYRRMKDIRATVDRP